MNTNMLQLEGTFIGGELTRLPTLAHFDPMMLASPAPSLHCTLGLPPQHLREVHWPALLEECVTRVRAAIANPVQVELDGPLRRVSVLGVLVYERDFDGQYQLYEWHPGEVMVDEHDDRRYVDTPVLKRLRAGSVAIDGAPDPALWLDRYAHGLQLALCFQWYDHELIDAYVDWAILKLKQRFWTESVQRRAQAKVASALKLDKKVLQRARRWLTHEDGSPTSLDDYNTVLWRRQQWRQLTIESPQWLPLLRQLWRYLPTWGDPLANLKEYLRGFGVSPAMWRLLHREGTAWIWPLRNYYTKDCRHGGQAALELVLKAQMFGTHKLVSIWMLQALMNLDGNPNRPRNSYLKEPEEPIDAPMAARLGQWAAEMSLAGDELGLWRLQE